MVEGTQLPTPPPSIPKRCAVRSTASPRAVRGAHPEDAAQGLQTRLAGLPITEVLFWASIAGMPDDLVERHIELLCTRLRPLVAGL